MAQRAGLAMLVAVGALAFASVAEASPTAARPVVWSIKSSVATVPATGGKVSVNAFAEHATTCIFSGAGLNSLRAPCASGLGGVKVTFTANDSPSDHPWTIYVIAKGPGGTSRWAHVTIDQQAEPSQGTDTTQTANPSTIPTGVPVGLAPYLDACSSGPDCLYGPISNVYNTYGNVAPADLGDCTFAAAADWEQIVLGIHPEPTLIGYEFASAGGTSAGLSLAGLWSYWTQQGIGGVVLDGVTEYTTDHAAVENGVRDYGALIVTLTFGPSAYLGQYAVPQGNHAVVVDGFTPEGPLVVSWGQTIQMTWQQWDVEVTGMYGVAAH